MKIIDEYFLESSFKEEIQPIIKYQIEAKEDSFGCTVNFASPIYSEITIKMELVRKNKTNKVLFDLPLVDLIQIVKAITKKIWKEIQPFLFLLIFLDKIYNSIKIIIC
jgi:hypothetical protein